MTVYVVGDDRCSGPKASVARTHRVLCLLTRDTRRKCLPNRSVRRYNKEILEMAICKYYTLYKHTFSVLINYYLLIQLMNKLLNISVI